MRHLISVKLQCLDSWPDGGIRSDSKAFQNIYKKASSRTIYFSVVFKACKGPASFYHSGGITPFVYDSSFASPLDGFQRKIYLGCWEYHETGIAERIAPFKGAARDAHNF